MQLPTQHNRILEAVLPLVKGCYELPKFPGKKVFIIVPLSGGIDSFSVAYVMLALFPNEPLTFLHADTGTEKYGTKEAFDQFEAITGRKVLKLIPKDDMLTMIANSGSKGNYLPSRTARTCTQKMKTLPFERVYDQLIKMHGPDTVFLNLVGIRADEPTRTGIEWKNKQVATSFPLQALGLVKQDVNQIIDSIHGSLPMYYYNHSRSGCQICIYSRKSELIDSWVKAPELVSRAADLEEVPQATLKVYNALPKTISEITGIARNWMRFYRPSRLGYEDAEFEHFRGKKTKFVNGQVDLFGADRSKIVYLAVEYEYASETFGFCAEPFVYFERIITFSNTLGGIKTAMKKFWLHRLNTRSLHGAFSEDDMKNKRQLQILEVEVYNYDMEIPPKPEGVFTWTATQIPIYAIRKAMAVFEHILLTEGFHQQARSNKPSERKDAINALSKIAQDKCYGRILSSMKYDPLPHSELIDDFDIVDEPVACLACSR
ncbi:phosphoadenosine phosphosulfate reductase family protein [Vibrio sp. Y2-5]|uniref:phosphoadenosine phosphosulfate reductase family protein n=1 Tax=Vibrio sp. Y2-5 TaxID=2743977 RepID=UPI0016601676|nr:phosphoadenosine phosphosulfate reductase family protein [Vibrio sp. Y2-5]MBD0788144.1 phosphoadenosine phosphosulfate reductase family protein [Vibrio sp. Y2-5]